MKLITLIVVVFAFVAALTQTSLADGILRIPSENGDDSLMFLTTVDVQVEIFDQVAITTIRNRFENPYDAIVNGMYHYRLPNTASVAGFGYWRDGELVELVLRPGEQGGPGGGVGDNNALREFLGSNPFSAPLDSLFPGPFMIYLRYVQLLPYDFGEVSQSYPLFTGVFLADPIDTVSISVTVESRREIADLTLGSYEDLTEMEMADEFHAGLVLSAEDMTPEQDWTLNIQYIQEDIGAWLYTHRSDQERSGYFMLVIDPGIVDTGEVVSKYFTFVLDRSGSMGGNKIVQARQAVLNCFDHLLPHDFFNIIDFATDVQMYGREMLAADDENIAAARRYVGGIEAQGSTNIYQALTDAIGQDMGEDAANQIIFTTDGLPTAGQTNPEIILRDITNNNEMEARIFSFGIGSDVNEALLAGLSEANHGISIFFNPNEERIDRIISDFYRYLAYPALVNPIVDIPREIEVDSLYPLELQDVAMGKQLYLFGRYESFGTVDIELSGQVPEGDTTMTFVEMNFPEEEAGNEFVPRMWAKSVIDYWLNYMRIHGEDDEIVERIIQLSIEYGILTPYTEFGEDDDDDDDGERNGIETPRIASFTGTISGGAANLSWSVGGSLSSVSFNIYRSDDLNGRYVRINDQPISGYSYRDDKVSVGAVLYYRVEIVTNGEGIMSEPFRVGTLPDQFALADPFPNPFNGTTRINFTVSRKEQITLTLYDLHSRSIATLLDRELNVGEHYISLNGGELKLANGTYIVRMEAGERKMMKKLVYLK